MKEKNELFAIFAPYVILKVNVMENNHELLIKIISDKRIELGYSQRALAKMMNVSNSYISKIESFKRNDISLVNLIKICECLELDFINLLVVTNYLPTKYLKKEPIIKIEKKYCDSKLKKDYCIECPLIDVNERRKNE